jgi:hypothetical protein
MQNKSCLLQRGPPIRPEINSFRITSGLIPRAANYLETRLSVAIRDSQQPFAEIQAHQALPVGLHRPIELPGHRGLGWQ